MLTGLLLVFGGGAHYTALVLGWRRQREFVDRYIRQARRAAWGDELGVRGIPGLDSTGAAASTAAEGGEPDAMPINRRQKRLMERGNRKESRKGTKATRDSGASTPTAEAAGGTGDRKRVVAENGKILIVDSAGNVFLEEETEDGERQEFLLDIDEIQRPAIRDTMLFRVPAWCLQKTIGRLVWTWKVRDHAISISQEPLEVVDQTVNEASTGSAVSDGSGSYRRRGRRSQKT